MKKNKANKKDKAEKQNLSEVDVIGTVLEARPNAMFDVELENGQRVLCTISGKIRVKHIHITPGDKCLIGGATFFTILMKPCSSEFPYVFGITVGGFAMQAPLIKVELPLNNAEIRFPIIYYLCSKPLLKTSR